MLVYSYVAVIKINTNCTLFLICVINLISYCTYGCPGASNLEAVVQVMPRDTLAARDWFKYPGYAGVEGNTASDAGYLRECGSWGNGSV